MRGMVISWCAGTDVGALIVGLGGKIVGRPAPT